MKRNRASDLSGTFLVNRYKYLLDLVTEFQESDHLEDKLQVLGNLANFAYDPINHDFLKQVGAIDLFIDNLAENHIQITQFSLTGISNLCANADLVEFILSRFGHEVIANCLLSLDTETVLASLTCLYYLAFDHRDIIDQQLIKCVSSLRNSSEKRLQVLATVFLEDFESRPEQLTSGSQCLA